MLILHGEKDLTILFGEGEMMFYALRQLGKTAELVSYANGDHSLSRHSRADALDVNSRILEWFARYLQPAAGHAHAMTATPPMRGAELMAEASQHPRKPVQGRTRESMRTHLRIATCYNLLMREARQSIAAAGASRCRSSTCSPSSRAPTPAASRSSS